MNQTNVSSTTAGKRIAFIQASWHHDIVDQCRVGFLEEIAKLGYSESQIEIFKVPGVFEIPLQAQLLAQSHKYDCIVGTGFIVDGGIYRHEFVSDAVINGIMRVQLDTQVPVISAILTPQRFHEHEEHRAFFTAHFVVKGREAAQACARTIVNLESLTKKKAA